MATPTTIRFQIQASAQGTALSGAGATQQIFPAQQVVGPSSGLSTVVGGAGTRNLCNFLTDLVIHNTNTTASVVTILDGSTVIWAGFVPSDGVTANAPIHFTTPLRGSPNTAMSIKQVSASALLWNAQGFVAAQAL